MLVLDSGGVSKLATRDQPAAALLIMLRRRGLWPPVVPTVVLVESLTGDARRDTNTNRLIKACDVRPAVHEHIARRAADLRTRAGCGSAVDALTIAIAEPGGTVLTGDKADLSALAANAANVTVKII